MGRKYFFRMDAALSFIHFYYILNEIKSQVQSHPYKFAGFFEKDCNVLSNSSFLIMKVYKERMAPTMKVGYTTIKSTLYSKDCGQYTAYGIVCHTEDHCIKVIADISTNAAFVDMVAQRFNAGVLSPYHFLDAVMDHIP